MSKDIRTVIISTGKYIPSVRVPNSYFLYEEPMHCEPRKFYGANHDLVRYSEGEKQGKPKPARVIVDNIKKITDISERRWATGDIVTSDMCVYAATDAITSAHIDPESIDMVIVAHNFGDSDQRGTYQDLVPSIASRVKNKMGITAPTPIARDIIASQNDFEWLMDNGNFFSSENAVIMRVGHYPSKKIIHDSPRPIY